MEGSGVKDPVRASARVEGLGRLEEERAGGNSHARFLPEDPVHEDGGFRRASEERLGDLDDVFRGGKQLGASRRGGAGEEESRSREMGWYRKGETDDAVFIRQKRIPETNQKGGVALDGDDNSGRPPVPPSTSCLGGGGEGAHARLQDETSEQGRLSPPPARYMEPGEEEETDEYRVSADGDMYVVSGGRLDCSDNLGEDNTDGMVVDGLYGTEMRTEKFKVRVSDPEVRSGTAGPLSKHIVYLVTGSSRRCGQFSSRKRYSDFQWLRDQLVLSLPGVFVPPLPRKQKLGRFEEQFVEARRTGLEEFLGRLLNRKNICDTSLFRIWLVRGEGGMEMLKKEFASRRSQDVLNDYKLIYAPYVNNIGSCSRSHLTRFIWFKQFLQKHLATLQELHGGLSKLASLSNSQFYTISNVLSEFCDLKRQENDFLSKVPDIDQPGRDDISGVIYAEAQRRRSAPAHVYDLMEYILAREIEDTESMVDATSSLDRLVNLKHQNHHATDREEQSLRVVQRSSRGGFMAAWFHRKDKDTQMHEIRVNIEGLRAEILTLDELIDLSRLVLVCSEMPVFLKSKIVTYNVAVREFMHKQQAMAMEEVDVWRSYFTGFMTSVAGIPPEACVAVTPPPLPAAALSEPSVGSHEKTFEGSASLAGDRTSSTGVVTSAAFITTTPAGPSATVTTSTNSATNSADKL
eukprot:GHVS01037716.1.p1 GENE.GHVS01037716.1~~GHVS01037716.1.p1  ORF type:complete len:689 (+),score=133.26 GHVS01037716.1:247-2313(+)